jgi:hypothetical protein
MPCNCDGMEAATAKDRERELDRLARLLCEACEIIQATRGGIAMTSGLREWWFAHESADRRRAAGDGGEGGGGEAPGRRPAGAERGSGGGARAAQGVAGGRRRLGVMARSRQTRLVESSSLSAW